MNRLWDLPLWFQRASEARQCVTGSPFLKETRGPERPFSEAVRVEPRQCVLPASISHQVAGVGSHVGLTSIPLVSVFIFMPVPC